MLITAPIGTAAVMLPDGELVGATRIVEPDGTVTWDGNRPKIAPPGRAVPLIEAQLAVRREELRRMEAYVEDVRSQASGGPAQPIVAAIVVSPLGVLVGKRRDGKPPWTFIAGEVEPGELPVDAAVREVKEETGLEIRAGQVIGERDHPKTGRHMIYMAAAPVRGLEVFVGDRDELAEVRWVSLAEADQLMGGMIYEPVHEYLARELQEQGDDQR